MVSLWLVKGVLAECTKFCCLFLSKNVLNKPNWVTFISHFVQTFWSCKAKVVAVQVTTSMLRKCVGTLSWRHATPLRCEGRSESQPAPAVSLVSRTFLRRPPWRARLLRRVFRFGRAAPVALAGQPAVVLRFDFQTAAASGQSLIARETKRRKKRCELGFLEWECEWEWMRCWLCHERKSKRFLRAFSAVNSAPEVAKSVRTAFGRSRRVRVWCRLPEVLPGKGPPSVVKNVLLLLLQCLSSSLHLFFPPARAWKFPTVKSARAACKTQVEPPSVAGSVRTNLRKPIRRHVIRNCVLFFCVSPAIFFFGLLTSHQTVRAHCSLSVSEWVKQLTSREERNGGGVPTDEAKGICAERERGRERRM